MKATCIKRAALAALILVSLWAGTVHAATLPPMHVGRIQVGYQRLGTGGYAIWAVVAIHDLEHMPVAGALVTAQWSLPPGGGGPQQKVVTNVQGRARFQIQAVERGVYRVCVGEVAKPGWAYAPALNELTCASVSVG